MPSSGSLGNQSKTGQKDSPETIERKRAYWTPERREQRRQQMLQRNPAAIYHGLSHRMAKRMCQLVGHCERCHSPEQLDVHHRDRDKHNHTPSNLEILCHRCHMQDHAAQGETGWDSYHQKRKSHPDSGNKPHPS
jgi:hypothetical protein